MSDAQRLSDELEIAALLSRYAHAVDTKDWELYRSVFTDDAYIDYTAAGVIAGSLDEVTDFFRQTLSVGVAMSMHYITNIETELDGDTARVRAMFYNPTQIHGMDELCFFGGLYTTTWSARRTVGAAVISARNPCGLSTPRAKFSPRRPIDHRRLRFRGHECRAQCTTRHARGPVERTHVRQLWGWRPTRCRVSGSAE